MHLQIGTARIELLQGDLTRDDSDAIVNAANSGLMGGGGVDGAIHRAGGPVILEECREIVASRGRLPTGQAVITGGGRLPARHVIHTVGPVYSGRPGDPKLLASCHTESLKLAAECKLVSVAFPAISTGVYGYPVEKAAPVALRAVAEFLKGNPEGPVRRVRFVLFSAAALEAFRAAARQTQNAEL
ncbi:MAG TPA: O-acetyl-ADP-ribose deacetylase [Planctomycetota bacterium]|nr:O-acetyl-ADP-ribose deacetylase [Planctomycetota bacterium]